MIIVHENLQEEASKIAEAVKEVFGVDSEVLERNFENSFIPLPEFDGYLCHLFGFREEFNFPAEKAIFAVTARDIYAQGRSKDDDWVFGACLPPVSISVASTARLKRPDSEPSKTLEVPEELYQKRYLTMSIHEIGHDLVKADHFQIANYVNAKTGHGLRLGPHCTDPRCVMYEIIDIKAPNPEEEYMLLGQQKRFDAGLDDVIARMHPDWFCDRCKVSIEISEKYK